ncbi:MAG TPA: FKBP-type peptidyl-prolyl cis-trans isomerase [Spongiibacteraceae bacterium]|jgi:FKBP-type peptidyl-prolyl cis-trans isomerase
MRTKLILCAAIATALIGCQPKVEKKELKLQTDEQKVSYGIGLMEGKRFKQDFNVDIDAFTAGLKASISGDKALMTEDEIKTTIQTFGQKLMAKREEEQKAQGEKNKTASAAFMTENGKKEGIKTAASGLQYKIVTEGKGAKPKADDTVEVNYKGTLIDGTEFDSSYKRGQPVTFPVNGVIPGWTEALQLMPVGSKFELFIPSDLAYGPGGTGGVIGPNQALIFEVELLDIKKPEKK